MAAQVLGSRIGSAPDGECSIRDGRQEGLDKLEIVACFFLKVDGRHKWVKMKNIVQSNTKER